MTNGTDEDENRGNNNQNASQTKPAGENNDQQAVREQRQADEGGASAAQSEGAQKPGDTNGQLHDAGDAKDTAASGKSGADTN